MAVTSRESVYLTCAWTIECRRFHIRGQAILDRTEILGRNFPAPTGFASAEAISKRGSCPLGRTPRQCFCCGRAAVAFASGGRNTRSASHHGWRSGCPTPGSVQRRLNAIAEAHKAAGLDSPTHAGIVRNTLKGIRRTLGTAQAQKAHTLTDDISADRRDRDSTMRARAMADDGLRRAVFRRFAPRDYSAVERIRIAPSLHSCAHAGHESVEISGVNPADDGDQVEVGVNIDHVGTVADVAEDVLGSIGKHLLAGVEIPVHEAVAGVGLGGSERPLHPLLGEDLFAVPLAAVQGEEAEAGHVLGGDNHAASVVAATGGRLDHHAIERDPGVVVAIPAPGAGGADWVHEVVAEDLLEGATPDLKDRVGEQVDADVVVLPGGAGFGVLALDVLLEGDVLGRAICPVWLAPQRPFPVAGLAQEVVPGDAAVVPGSEVLAGDVVLHQIVEVADETVVEGESDHRREEALGDAERHVGPKGFAPLRDDVAVADDHTGGFAAGLEGSERVAVGFAGERQVVGAPEITGVLGFVGAVPGDSFVDFGLVHAGRGRVTALPVATGGEVRSWLGEEGLEAGEEDQGAEHNGEDIMQGKCRFGRSRPIMETILQGARE